jgi:hypothetical protein
LNQQCFTTSTTPGDYQFYTNNTAPGSVTLFRFDFDARIGTIQITQGFNNYYEILSNTVTTCTFIQLNGSAWATYRFSNFFNGGTYWEVKNPVPITSSVGFTFSNNTYYCIYMQIVI